MNYEDVERIVLAVAKEYDFFCWRTMFRQGDRFVVKDERERRKEATAMCATILSKLPTMTQRTASEILGFSQSFISTQISQEKYKYVNNNSGFYQKYDRITSAIRAEKEKAKR